VHPRAPPVTDQAKLHQVRSRGGAA